MKIRLMQPRDMADVFSMSLRFFEASPYRHLRFSPEKASSLIISYLDEPEKRVAIVAVDGEDQPVGILAGQLSEVLFSDQKVAAETVWWVDPEFRGPRTAFDMLEAFEHWAAIVGASFVQMQSLEGEHQEKLDKLFKRKGYVPREYAYLKEVTPKWQA